MIINYLRWNVRCFVRSSIMHVHPAALTNSHTLSVFNLSNSCSETICPQPTITLLQKQNGRNYSAITILHQSKTSDVFNFRWPQRRGENETQRHVRAEVTSLWYYVIQWIKGQLHPKDQNHIFPKSPWAVLVILWELQRMRALGFKYIWAIKHWKDCFKWPAQVHLRLILSH